MEMFFYSLKEINMKTKALIALLGAGIIVSSSALATPKLFRETQVQPDGSKVKAYRVECSASKTLTIAQTEKQKWCFEGAEKSYCNRNQAKVAKKACKIG